MRILVIAEHDGQLVRSGSLAALGFAREISEATGADCQLLVIGHQIAAVANGAAAYAPVLRADDPLLEQPVADRYAQVIADVASQQQADMLVAASTTWSKDIVARAAGLLGGTMASEVTGHKFCDGQLQLVRPIFAGAVNATVVLSGGPAVVTVRASSYQAPESDSEAHSITLAEIESDQLPTGIHFERLDAKTSARPDVTEARIVISGGRAFKNSDDFERLVGGLADSLGAATGSSRALVDAGITPNSLQVGQTGKVVAPDLYVAMGISGAVQHLAGMKNSKVIVAINSDRDAPIFDVADYGLVGDVYEIAPAMMEKLSAK